MRIESPLSNLRDVLAQVRETAKTYNSTLATNEDATRAALIDPVLRALGWDTANIDMVVVEKTHTYAGTMSRPDYALQDKDARVRFIVEAKPLGRVQSQLALKHILQLAGYANAFNKVKDLFLTDGLVWQHYDLSVATANNIKPLQTLDIGDTSLDSLNQTATYLIQKLDAAQVWPEEQEVVSPEILKLQQDYSALEQRIAALETGSASPPLPPKPIVWVDISKLQDVKNTNPSQLRFPDGSQVPVGSWAQALIAMCEFVIRNNSTLTLPFKDKAGGRHNLLDTVPFATGKSSKIETRSGRAVFIYRNYSANDCVANIKHILSQMPAAKQSMNPAVVYAPV